MDETNKQILKALRANSRMPFLKIAEKLSVSEGTIRKRVDNLLKSGQIRKFTIEENLETSAIVHIMTSTSMGTEKISSELMRIKGVIKIFEVTGKYSVYCLIKGTSMYEINDILEQIRLLKGVVQTETHTVLREY
ncbi:MAG: Lrp/AsnC family transcriptional regulator [Nanoarchaeota archaeon]|nr:Lrp/AsnC family transcriptional regulator [Nanoarchaeota archaeon]